MNLTEARSYFVQMGGSHFHMSREEPDVYAQYRALKITDAQEKTWRGECIDALAARLAVTSTPEWQQLSQLIDHCENQCDLASLQTLRRSLDAVHTRLDPLGSVIIAEMLIGTALGFERGGIYLAVQLQQLPVARHFAETSMALATRADVQATQRDRSAKAVRKCAAVRKHFGI